MNPLERPDDRTVERHRAAVRTVLARIAPEADLDAVPPDASLSEELDLDSMDFLNFVIGLADQTGVEIPEDDYGQVSSLADCLAYLARHDTGQGEP